MTTPSRAWRTILVFVAIAYGLAIALSLAVGLTGGANSPLAGLGFVSMFVPAIAAIAVGAITGDRARVDWSRVRFPYLPVALFLIPGLINVVALAYLSASIGTIPWQDWLTPGPDGLYRAPASRGWGVMTPLDLAWRIGLNAVVGVVVVSVLAMFEEIGWRAWLLPRLIERMGVRRAIISTSIIWAVWHVPFALSGILHVDGMSPLMLAASQPIGTVIVGLVIGWLWVKTESIWIVSIAHGAFNNWGQLAFKYMRDFSQPDPVAVLGAGLVAVAAVGIVLLATLQERRP